jgi:hypothetical protein
LEILKLLVPVLWAMVAALIGRWLYRYSTAKFHVRWAGFTGSAAIALACFYGLYRATPRSLIERVPPGEIIVDEPRMKRISDLAESAGQELDRAKATCVDEHRNEEECQRALQSLELLNVKVAIELRGITDAH